MSHRLLLVLHMVTVAPASARADAIGQLCSAAGAGSCPGRPSLHGLARPERPGRIERSEPCYECYRRRAEALARMVHLSPEREIPVTTPDEVARAVAVQIERDDRRRLERLAKLRAALGSFHPEPPDYVRPQPGGVPGTLTDECRDNPELLRQLSAEVAEKCKKGSRKCKSNQDCDTLRQNLQKNMDCLAARETRDNRCFDGGDAVHKKARDETGRAISTCNKWIKRKCP